MFSLANYIILGHHCPGHNDQSLAVKWSDHLSLLSVLWSLGLLAKSFTVEAENWHIKKLRTLVSKEFSNLKFFSWSSCTNQNWAIAQ